jgi:hypothetical protein
MYDVTIEEMEGFRTFWVDAAERLSYSILLTSATRGRLVALAEIMGRQTTPESLSRTIQRVSEIEHAVEVKETIHESYSAFKEVYAKAMCVVDGTLKKEILDAAEATDSIDELYAIYERLQQLAGGEIMLSVAMLTLRRCR